MEHHAGYYRLDGTSRRRRKVPVRKA